MSDDEPSAQGATSDQASAAPGQYTLDARHLLCPLPVIRTQDRVAELAPGDELTVVATDPGTLHDVPAWCRVHGHSLLATEQDGREIRVRLRVN